ncbi:cytochrome P450 71A26-like, partial [Trifolium medium]|nr:cytochrome P450 71A26-like [Trifolium medium]
MMEYIKECCSSTSPLNLTELCSTITNDIVCRVALGKRYGEGRGMKFQEVSSEFEELLGAEKCAKYLDEFMEQVIEEHISRRSDGDVSVDSEDQNDFVDVLLSVQKTNKSLPLLD